MDAWIGRKRADQRHLIVHYHIFKNAGSSVDRLLNANFPGACKSIEASNPWEAFSPPEFVHQVRRLSERVKAISSHTLRPVPLSLPGTRLHSILFIRNPLERAKSVYNFARQQPDSDKRKATIVAKEQSLDDFIRWRLSQPGCVISNFQTIFLSARELNMKTARANADDYLRAVQALKRLPCFGIVDQFEASVEAIFAYLSAYFKGLKVFPVHENPSYLTNDVTLGKAGMIRDQLSKEVYQLLLEANDLDLKLYERACEIFRDSQEGESRA